MKIIADNKEEFDEIVRTSVYLHDFSVETNKRINWKFWQWFYINDEGRLYFDPHNADYVCLDLDEYPVLNSLAHLYRIKHAGTETNGMEEQKALDNMFFMEKKP